MRLFLLSLSNSKKASKSESLSLLSLTLLTAIITANLSSLSFAQEQNNEDSRLNERFYPHDYARNPLDLTPKPGAVATSKAVSNKDQVPEFTGRNPRYQDPVNEPRGKPILSISLISTGLDFPILKQHLATLLNLYNQKSIKISTIYMVGQAAQLPPEDLNNLIRRLGLVGAVFNAVKSPPPNIHIKKIPTWILTTSEGDIVLEALNSPEKLINSKAEFIDPKDLEDFEGQDKSAKTTANKPTATPTPTLKPVKNKGKTPGVKP